MFKTGLRASVLVLALFAPGSARAEEAKPINLALFTPIQIFPAETSIHGFRLSLLYGVNREMHGLDVGLVNRATGGVAGFQWGVVNWDESTLEGVQLSFVNYLGGKGVGAQLATVNIAEAQTGLQWGFVNYAPRIRIPTLMLNGRYDFGVPVETAQNPLFALLGSAPDQKSHRVYETGHALTIEGVRREILPWLDRVLGPVPTINR